MKRETIKRPGFDCVRHPCGKNGCGTTPGSSHGVHGDDWVFVVSEGDVALSLTVFSNILPASVPADMRLVRAPDGADLSLHVGFPVADGFEHECAFVAGGKCYQGGRFSGALIAQEFWETHGVARAGLNQPERFWLAMERELATWADEARAERCVVVAKR